MTDPARSTTPPPTPEEREEWKALVEADTLHMLPKEALVASVQHLALRLLEVTYVLD